jgi:hypothetical protein
VCMYVSICVFVYVCIYVCMHVWMDPISAYWMYPASVVYGYTSIHFTGKHCCLPQENFDIYNIYKPGILSGNLSSGWNSPVLDVLVPQQTDSFLRCASKTDAEDIR